MIYLIIGIILIIMTYIEAYGKSKKFSNYSLIFISISMVLFASLRDKVGTDWDAYFEFYTDTTDRVEIGYSYINNLFSFLNIPYNIFLFFINGLSVSLIFLFLKNNTKLKVIGLLLFFSNLYLYYNFSGIRQGIAISITCFSITYAINKQLIKFILLILIAASFHFSSIIFIIAYFLPRFSFNYRQKYFLIIIFVIFYFFLDYISDWITLYTIKNANFYVNLQDKSDSLLQTFLIGLVIRLLIVFIVFIFHKKIFLIDNCRYFFNIYLFGIFLFFSTYMISPDIGVRLSSYFTIFDLVIVGNLIFVLQRQSNRFLIVSIFAFISIYKLLIYMNSEYYSYKLFFNFNLTF